MMNRWFAIHIILSLQCRDGPFVSPICIYMFYLQKATLRNPPRKRLLIYLVSLLLLSSTIVLVFHKCNSNESTSHLIANGTRIQVLWWFPSQESQAFGWASGHPVAFIQLKSDNLPVIMLGFLQRCMMYTPFIIHIYILYIHSIRDTSSFSGRVSSNYPCYPMMISKSQLYT